MINVVIGATTTALRAGLAQARGQAKQFSTDLKGMLSGAFSVQAIMGFAEKMRDIQNEAARFGTSAENVQRLGKVARQSGTDFEALGHTLSKVTTEALHAAGGGEKASLFKKLGIDAKEFASLSMDQKLLVLASAYQRVKGDAGATAEMVELLGERGSEIIPLLAQGPDVLSQGMKGATVQTNETVAAMAKMAASFDKIKGIGSRVLGTIMDKFVALGKWVGRVSGMIAMLSGGSSWKEATAAADAVEADEKAEAAKEAENAKNGTGGESADSNEVAKVGRIAELKKANAEAEERYRLEELQGEARIAELLQQRAALESKINDTTVEGLEAKRLALTLEHEITEEQKRQEENAAKRVAKGAEALAKGTEKKQDAKAKEREDLAAARAKEADVLERQYLAKASPAERKKYLTDKQSGLMDESRAAERRNDHVAAIKKRTEAEELQDQIDAAGSKKDRSASVVTDSLQRMGGGGGIGPALDPMVRAQDKTNDLLQKLLEAQRPEGSGESRPRTDY